MMSQFLPLQSFWGVRSSSTSRFDRGMCLRSRNQQPHGSEHRNHRFRHSHARFVSWAPWKFGRVMSALKRGLLNPLTKAFGQTAARFPWATGIGVMAMRRNQVSFWHRRVNASRFKSICLGQTTGLTFLRRKREVVGREIDGKPLLEEAGARPLSSGLLKSYEAPTLHQPYEISEIRPLNLTLDAPVLCLITVQLQEL